MKLSITTKLFLVILITTIVVAVIMGLTNHYSFSHGFINYVKERENKSLNLLKESLIEAYTESGNWDFILRDRKLWHQLRYEPSDNRSPLFGPLALYDADKNFLRGPRDLIKTGQIFPIEINGKTIGFLARPYLQNHFTIADKRFETSQYRALLITSALSVLIAAVVAIFLTRVLLRPLRKIGSASHQLAAGNYSIQIPITSFDEVGQLAQDFNHLARTLERNETSRQEFMADIAHELRTPLAILKGELEALADGVRSLTPESIDSLEAEVKILNKLVNDLGQLSQADLGALTYKKTTVDVTALIERTIASYKDRFEQNRIQIDNKTSRSHIIFGDPDRLTQLFTNLLENSLRYTDPDGQLQIDTRTKGSKLFIDFNDTAPGVPTEALPRIFDRLYRQESSRNRACGGSGLGLSIAARIVEAHEGKISAHPSPLGGIHIEIEFPINTKIHS